MAPQGPVTWPTDVEIVQSISFDELSLQLGVDSFRIEEISMRSTDARFGKASDPLRSMSPVFGSQTISRRNERFP